MSWLLLSFLAVIVVCVDDFPFGKDVVVLKTSDFKKLVNIEEYYLVMFYQFSPYSQSAVPVLQNLGEKCRKSDNVPVKIGVVNCQNDELVCKEYDTMAQNAPVLKLLRKGVEYRMYGKDISSADSIFEWLRILTRTRINQITTLGELKELQNEFPKSSFLLQIYHPNKPPEESLSQISEFLNEIVVVTIDMTLASDKLLKKLRISKNKMSTKDANSILMLYRHWKKSYKKLKSTKLPEDREKLISEVFEFGFPPVSELTELSLARMGTIGGSVNCILFFDYDLYEDERSRSNLLKASEAIATKKLGEVAFGYTDSNDDYFRIYTNIGGSEDEIPNIACFDLKNNKRFIYQSDLYSEEDIEVFVTRIQEGKISEKIKSEKFPTQNEPVFKIVAKTYDDVMNKNHVEKDIIVMFYQVTEATSQMKVKGRGEESFEKVAIHYQSYTEKILIAKFDVSKNDIVDKNVKLSKIPEIFLFPKNQREKPRRYNGEFEKEEIIDFIKRHAQDFVGDNDQDEL